MAASPDPDAAFGVQRLARKLGAPASQAIDATNEAALRVMVRQVGKALGGLDAVVDATGAAGTRAVAEAVARREMDRTGGGVDVIAIEPVEVVRAVAGEGA